MAVGRGGDTARTVWKAVGDVSGRPGSRAGLRWRARAARSTRAKGFPARGTRRQPAPRPPCPVHGPRRPLAPAHSTSHDARSFAPKRTLLAAARWERARGAAGHRFRHTTLGSGSTGSGSESTRRCRTKPATSPAAAVPQHQAASSSARRPHHHGNGGPPLRTRRRAENKAASSAGCNTQPKPAPLAPAHVAATGGRSTESGGRRQGGDSDRTEAARSSARQQRQRRQRPHGGAGSRAQRQRQSPESGGAVHHGNGGPTAATAVSHGGRPGEPRTTTRTGNKNNGLLETL